MKIPRKSRRLPYVPTASFGDIAFLLIIFFMVASTFMREKHIAVNEATAEDLERAELAPISVVLDKDGNLWLQGSPCPKDALEPAVSALLSENEDHKVTVKIDKDQPQEKFGYILKALSTAGADLMLLGKEEKK